MAMIAAATAAPHRTASRTVLGGASVGWSSWWGCRIRMQPAPTIAAITSQASTAPASAISPTAATAASRTTTEVVAVRRIRGSTKLTNRLMTGVPVRSCAGGPRPPAARCAATCRRACWAGSRRGPTGTPWPLLGDVSHQQRYTGDRGIRPSRKGSNRTVGQHQVACNTSTPETPTTPAWPSSAMLTNGKASPRGTPATSAPSPAATSGWTAPRPSPRTPLSARTRQRDPHASPSAGRSHRRTRSRT